MTKLNGWRIGAVFAYCALTGIGAPAQTLTTVVNFDRRNGSWPYKASLSQATDGNLYGATETGGANDRGTIFRLTPSGNHTVVHSFNFTDGASPLGTPVQGIDGSLYGTTDTGGATGCEDNGCGTVFKLTPSGKLITLHQFCLQNQCPDGLYPEAGLVQATDGNFYGTTAYGGAYGAGTVFRITPGGVLTTIYSFCAGGNPCVDGSLPFAGLTQASDGGLYGTTAFGGTYGEGTIFKISLEGTLTVVYTFCSQPNCGDGAEPFGGVVEAADGKFYGTTAGGGTGGYGTVFRVTFGGKLTTLSSFDSMSGTGPTGGLIQGTDSLFYGTTVGGGTSNYGTVFSMTPTGTLTVLHNFAGYPTDGAYSYSSLLQATTGSFYGVTYSGGDERKCRDGCGTVFNLDMGLSAFVALVRNPSKIGQGFGILGQGLAGSTAVELNGTPANFTVVSDTFIKATVPSGATTGYVTVTTPTGVLTSNVPFHVIQ
ncbi:MAG TPA: choice-of-anchor tandem repeat GloVer-containing protein [Terriglobales bacterium]|nr:choice-of-anchor tandem repeat GloVer-containing protein [Terriglobales bacterium]